MKLKKAQGAIEFVIIFAAVLFFFLTFFSIIKVNIEKKNLEKEKLVLQNLVLDVQSEIDLAAESSEGYYREFKIPENIFGKDYEINISSNRVYVSMNKIGISYKIFEVNGSIKKGVNVIRNEDETVFLN